MPLIPFHHNVPGRFSLTQTASAVELQFYAHAPLDEQLNQFIAFSPVYPPADFPQLAWHMPCSCSYYQKLTTANM